MSSYPAPISVIGRSRGCFSALLSTVTPPVNTVAPALNNTTPSVFDTVGVDNGTWDGSPTSFTYQWCYGGGTPIPGATSSDYTIDPKYTAAMIFCVVTAHNAGGATPAGSDVTNAVATIFSLELQTHKNTFETRGGDTYATPIGLWQDTSATIPATLAGDPVAAFTDVISGSAVAFTQSTSTQQPTLQFVQRVSDSVFIPTVAFDGVDDIISAPAMALVDNTIVCGFGNASSLLPYNGLIVGQDHSGFPDAAFLALAQGASGVAFGNDSADTVPASTWASVSAIVTSTQATLNSGSGDVNAVQTLADSADDITIADRASGARVISMKLVAAFIMSDSSKAALARAYVSSLLP